MNTELFTLESLVEIMGFDPDTNAVTYNLACALFELVAKCRKGKLCIEDAIALFDGHDVHYMLEGIMVLVVTLAASQDVCERMLMLIQEMKNESC